MQQAFPRGQTRSLSSARLNEAVERSTAEADDRRYMILLAVREDFTQIYLQQEQQKILQKKSISHSQPIMQDLLSPGKKHCYY